MRRFVDHLPGAFAEALRICSSCSWFDRALFQRYLRGFHIPLADSAFDEFCNLASALELEHSQKRFAIHDILRHFLSHQISSVEFGCIFECALNEAAHSLQLGEFRRSAALCAEALAITVRLPETPTTQLCELLGKVGRLLIDAGYWQVVEQGLRFSGKSVPPTIELWAILLRGLCARRNGRLREAEELLTAALREPTALGDEYVFARFHQAHTTHLLGHYDDAALTYRKLEHDLSGAPHEIDCKALATRQHADILMLKGHFPQAEQRFIIAQSLRPNNLMWVAESLRFRGHLFRFNFLFQKALALYDEAAKLASSVDAIELTAKILTSQAETLAWVSPAEGLKVALRAEKENSDVGNHIEVGKALAAAAISGLDLDDAIAYAHRARDLQERIGYRSGVAFALQSEAFALLRHREHDKARRVIDELSNLLSQIGVYNYLLAPLRYCQDPARFSLALISADWLDPTATANAFAHLLSTSR